jgi:hypothetical protein
VWIDTPRWGRERVRVRKRLFRVKRVRNIVPESRIRPSDMVQFPRLRPELSPEAEIDLGQGWYGLGCSEVEPNGVEMG